VLAAEQLTRFGRYGSATYAQIFSLFYIRLTALTLINTTPLAAQEVKALEDFSSSYYPDPIANTHLVPWELRVLA